MGHNDYDEGFEEGVQAGRAHGRQVAKESVSKEIGALQSRISELDELLSVALAERDMAKEALAVGTYAAMCAIKGEAAAREEVKRLRGLLEELLGYEVYCSDAFGGGDTDRLTVRGAIEEDCPDLGRRVREELGR